MLIADAVNEPSCEKRIIAQDLAHAMLQMRDERRGNHALFETEDATLVGISFGIRQVLTCLAHQT